MAHIVFTDQTTYEQFARDIDAACGYPRAGRRVNGGVHGPGGATTRYQGGLKHRSRNEWAYNEDAVVLERETVVPVPASATRQTLDSSWTDATPNAMAPQLE